MTPFQVVLAIYATASVVAFLMIGWDKRAARRGTWRIPERRLHVVELLGGFPGSFLARHLFRHKTLKFSYRLTFGAIVAVHVAAWAAWIAWLR